MTSIHLMAKYCTGPIFDAYDIRVLILPGSIGVVLCLVFMSLSTGKTSHLLNFKFTADVHSLLPIPPLFRRSWRNLLIAHLYTQSLCNRSLVLQTSSLCYWRCLLCRRYRRYHLLADHSLSHTTRWLPLGHPSDRFSITWSSHYCQHVST